MRVGLGVGAVALGGCDAVADAKARVLGQQASAPAAAEAAAEPAPVPVDAAPEPLLLSRGGVSGVVDEVRARSQAGDVQGAPRDPVSEAAPLGPLARPGEGSAAFVPYEGAGAGGALAVAPVEPAPVTKPRRQRPPRVTAPDEPCDPAPVTAPEWVCGPCGRG